MSRRTAGEGNVRRLSNGRYQARRWIGPRENVTEISASGATPDEARARLEDKVAAHQRRRLHDIDNAGDWTVAEFLQWWVDEELEARLADRTLATNSFTAYEVAVRLHLRPRLGKVRLADFRASHVRRLMSELAAAGMSPQRRRFMHTVLKAALRAAIQYEYIDRVNPVSLVKAPTLERDRKAPVSIRRVRALLAAAAGTRLEAYWRLMLNAPLRPNEALGADWDAFDLDGGVYELRRSLVRDHRERRWLWEPTKGRKARTVPLFDDTVDALRRHRAAQAAERLAIGDGWTGAQLVDAGGKVVTPRLAFTTPAGTPIHLPTIRAELARLCEVAEIPRMTPHQLRSAAVTLLSSLGVHPRVAQQLAGHSDLTTSDIYIGELDEAMRAAVVAMGESLRG